MRRGGGLVALVAASVWLAVAPSASALERRIDYDIARDALAGTLTFDCAPQDCAPLAGRLAVRLRPLSALSGKADALLDELHDACFAELARCQSDAAIKRRVQALNVEATSLRNQWVASFRSEILAWEALAGRRVGLSAAFVAGSEADGICGRRSAASDACVNNWPAVQAQFGPTPGMLAAIKYRRRLTDGLIAQTALEVLVAEPSLAQVPFKQIEPSGSYSYTSDLDVTIIGRDGSLFGAI